LSTSTKPWQILIQITFEQFHESKNLNFALLLTKMYIVQLSFLQNWLLSDLILKRN